MQHRHADQRIASRGQNDRSEEHTSELQSRSDLVCRLLLEKKKKAAKAVEPTIYNFGSRAQIAGQLIRHTFIHVLRLDNTHSLDLDVQRNYLDTQLRVVLIFEDT